MKAITRNRLHIIILEFIRNKFSLALGFNNADVTSRILRKILINTELPTILDVGANVGEFASLCLQSFPNASLICIEPQAELNSLIMENTNQRANILNLALSSRLGRGSLIRRDIGDRKAHLNSSKARESHIDLVEISTIDCILDKFAILKVDLLKIDTEGNDFNVLLGANNSLSLNKIDRILSVLTQVVY